MTGGTTVADDGDADGVGCVSAGSAVVGAVDATAVVASVVAYDDCAVTDNAGCAGACNDGCAGVDNVKGVGAGVVTDVVMPCSDDMADDACACVVVDAIAA